MKLSNIDRLVAAAMTQKYTPTRRSYESPKLGSYKDSKERSGRSTRLLEEAARLTQAGRAVYILYASVAQAEHARHTFEATYSEVHGVQFETEITLGDDLDVQRLKMLSAHPNCILLVDHHYIQWRYGQQLMWLHAFDQDFVPEIDSLWYVKLPERQNTYLVKVVAAKARTVTLSLSYDGVDFVVSKEEGYAIDDVQWLDKVLTTPQALGQA